jgi:hypothetical protein
MKGWFKVLKYKEHDLIVQHLSSEEDGEHLLATLRFSEGAYCLRFLYGTNDDSEQKAKEALAKFNKEDGQQVIYSFNNLMNDQHKKQDDKKQDQF